MELNARSVFVDAANFDALEQAVQRCGPVDSVVNCAGSLILKPAHLTTEKEWRETLEINLTSAFSTVRAAAKAMMNTGGSIVLCSTAAARAGFANHEAIAAAKGGVIGLTLSAAATYASRNIRVNCVAPGVIRTRFQDYLTPEQVKNNLENRIPLRREGTVDDVAEVITLLTENEFITGETIVIDGGITSRIA